MAGKKAFRLQLYAGAVTLGEMLLYTACVETQGGAAVFLQHVSAEMRALAKSGKCGSLVISVHQDGEACDHE